MMALELSADTVTMRFWRVAKAVRGKLGSDEQGGEWSPLLVTGICPRINQTEPMMNRSSLIAVGGAFCLSMLAAPVYANCDEHDAERDCERKISSDRRYKGLNNVKVRSQGNHSYNVTGKVAMDGKDQEFNCRVRHKEVVSWHVDSDHNGNSAAAIGAGVLAVAAVAALASSSDDGDRHHQQSRDRYRDGDEDAFEDMHYLKKECKHEIRRHLHQDHGAVDRLRFNGVHLNGRTLRGDGEVQFNPGGLSGS